jgi:hypothetical protein
MLFPESRNVSVELTTASWRYHDVREVRALSALTILISMLHVGRDITPPAARTGYRTIVEGGNWRMSLSRRIWAVEPVSLPNAIGTMHSGRSATRISACICACLVSNQSPRDRPLMAMLDTPPYVRCTEQGYIPCASSVPACQDRKRSTAPAGRGVGRGGRRVVRLSKWTHESAYRGQQFDRKTVGRRPTRLKIRLMASSVASMCCVRDVGGSERTPSGV